MSENLVSLCFAAAFLSHFIFFPRAAQCTKDSRAQLVVLSVAPFLHQLSHVLFGCSGTAAEHYRPCLVLCVLSGEEGCDKVHLLLSEVLPGSTRPSRFSLLLLSFFLPSSTVRECSVQSKTDSSDSGRAWLWNSVITGKKMDIENHSRLKRALRNSQKLTIALLVWIQFLWALEQF